MTRTHTCGALRPADVGAEVVLLGWVHRVRDLGGCCSSTCATAPASRRSSFDKTTSALIDKAKRLRSEFVIGVDGTRRRRAARHGQPEARRPARSRSWSAELRLLNEAKTPPFPIADETPVSEEVRLQYRYLDLRRPRLQEQHRSCATG